MRITSLRIIHRLKSGDDGAPPSPLQNEKAWLALHTCQRHLWVSDSEALSSCDPERLEDFELHESGDAYLFLLRVATGLESAVKGETEIFGQIRSAWQDHLSANPEEAHRISWTMQRLFEDTKRIRTDHLQGFGGSGYGSLVRKLLKDRPRGQVLLIGAGQLAQSVLPYLDAFDVMVCNRTRSKAEELVRGLPNGGHSPRVAESAEELELWASCTHAVVCAPLDEARDQARVAAWCSVRDRDPGSTVIHLGCDEPAPRPWSVLQERHRFHPLQDLFRLQREHSIARDLQVRRAEEACAARATERLLTDAEALALLG
ncbi:MAG: hypothetical protein IT285_14680 [Bdellovibrionales bacterium]|nr:hypothetical protein [Bdellovibrionales bacterium]